MPVGLTDDVWQVCGVSPLVGTRWGWKMPLSFYILQHIFLLLSAFFLFMLWPATIAAGLWWSIGRLTLKQQKISSPVYIQTHHDMVTPGLLHITLDRIFTPVVKSDETICWGCFVSIIQLSCRWNNTAAQARIAQKWAVGPWKTWNANEKKSIYCDLCGRNSQWTALCIILTVTTFEFFSIMNAFKPLRCIADVLKRILIVSKGKNSTREHSEKGEPFFFFFENAKVNK